MDPFLLEYLPLCYARVYKAVLQHRGQLLIPDTIKKLEAGANREDVLSGIRDTKLSRDVYYGIHQLIFMKENNRLEFLHKLTTKDGITPITESLDTVLLQLIQSDRWSKRFKHDVLNFDLILAVPKWSRVVSLSTSEIAPAELLQSIKQFDTLQLHGYHFYDFFNKLHGVTGRTVTIESKDDAGRIKNLARLSYLFRSCADLRMIAKSGNLRLFTAVPSTSNELRVGMFFMMVCKIGNARETRVSDGSGINLSGYTITLSDHTGTVDARLNTSPAQGSMWRNLADGHLRDEISGYLLSGSVEMNGLKTGYKHVDAPDFGHPQDLEKHNGSFLVMGSWFLGDDMANVTFVTPLRGQADTKKFSMLSYMNTRKRVPLGSLSKEFGIDQRHLSQPKPYSEFSSIVLDSKREWAYYAEQHWAKDVFLLLLENNLERPEASKVIRSGISVKKFYDQGREILRFFGLNDELKNLYLPGGKGLAEIYKPLEYQPKIIVPPGSKKFIRSVSPRAIEKALGIMPVKGWKNVERLCVQIKEHDFVPEEVFRWGNGGSVLENSWERLRQKNWRSTNDMALAEIRSALRYIYQARGMVFVPEIIHDKTFGN